MVGSGAGCWKEGVILRVFCGFIGLMRKVVLSGLGRGRHGGTERERNRLMRLIDGTVLGKALGM